jgi:hypothetical protein
LEVIAVRTDACRIRALRSSTVHFLQIIFVLTTYQSSTCGSPNLLRLERHGELKSPDLSLMSMVTPITGPRQQRLGFPLCGGSCAEPSNRALILGRTWRKAIVDVKSLGKLLQAEESLELGKSLELERWEKGI